MVSSELDFRDIYRFVSEPVLKYISEVISILFKSARRSKINFFFQMINFVFIIYLISTLFSSFAFLANIYNPTTLLESFSKGTIIYFVINILFDRFKDINFAEFIFNTRYRVTLFLFILFITFILTHSLYTEKKISK